MIGTRILRSYVLAATLAVSAVSVHAQKADTTYYPSRETGSVGVLAGAAENIHHANFQHLPGVPSCCPRYENGTGIVPNLLAEYERFLTPQLSGDLRFGYTPLSGTLSTREQTTVLDENGTAVPAVFEHTVAATVPAFVLQPLMRYGFTRSLSIAAGPVLSWSLKNSYDQKEVLLEPSTFGTFENGRRTRNESSGQTPDFARFGFGAHLDIGYELPIARSLANDGELHTTWSVRPELSGTYFFTDLVRGLSWRAMSVSVGVGIHRKLYESTPPLIVARVEPTRDTIPPPISRPAFTLGLNIIARDSLDRVYPLHQLTIEDYIRTQYRPLLNYVFFAKDSSRLPERYHRLTPKEANDFHIQRLNAFETLPLYYEVLNIIGERLRLNPSGRVTIVGCNDGTDEERAVDGLSRSRAMTVADYLENAWAISPSRIKIETRDLPQKPSSPAEEDGAEENRRVEIYSNLWQIVEPVFTTDTAHIPKPSVVSFVPQGSADSGIERWGVEVSESANKIKEFSGRGAIASGSDARLPELPSELDWELEKEPEALLARMDTVHATAIATDLRGEHATSREVILPVRHYTLEDKHREGSIDTIISRYSLILFDFDRSELSDANRHIADFVRDRISENARVAVLGYTDRIGSDSYNQQLSEARARSTQRYIGLPTAEVKGLGRSILLYDNALPEGRFYSRTVTVVVSTPTKR